MTVTNNWYLEYNNNPTALVNLFCFHHSGGCASFYYPWLEQLTPDIRLIAVQLPGRENRFMEPLNNNINDILFHLIDEFQGYTNCSGLIKVDTKFKRIS